MSMQHIVLVGYGAMARAILKACCHSFSFEIIGRDALKAQALADEFGQKSGGSAGFDGSAFEANGKNIVLAIKPYALDSFHTQSCANVVISVLAGVELAQLKRACPASYHIRAMPNVGAAYRKSCTALFAHTKHDLAQSLFEACGSVIWLANENSFDAAMALSSCAPAYLAMAAEALADAGVREGLNREESVAFVRGLFDSFTTLLLHEHPALIKESILSPSGVTIEGLAFLESHSFRGMLIEAIHAATTKVRK